MSLIDSMKDIVKHTSSLGFLEMVKIVGTPTDAKIEAIDADKTVVVFGDMYQPINDIDTTVGLSRLGILRGFMDLHADSNVEVVKEMRGTVNTPTELKFDNGFGSVSNYRFMSESMINEQIKVPPFKGAVWNVSFSPEKKNIANLNAYQGILGGFEKRFTVSVDKGTLTFSIGSGPTDRTSVPFATGLTGTLKSQWSYPLAQVMSILKLADTSATTTMNFSDMGALKIDVDSGIGRYSYILPAGKN
jgi:hypothetical protein